MFCFRKAELFLQLRIQHVIIGTNSYASASCVIAADLSLPLHSSNYEYRRSCTESADNGFLKRSLCSKCIILQQGCFVMLLFKDIEITVQNNIKYIKFTS